MDDDAGEGEGGGGGEADEGGGDEGGEDDGEGDDEGGGLGAMLAGQGGGGDDDDDEEEDEDWDGGEGPYGMYRPLMGPTWICRNCTADDNAEGDDICDGITLDPRLRSARRATRSRSAPRVRT